MDSEEYRKKILREILQIIRKKLISGEMKADRAKAIAQMVISRLIPNITLGEIYRIVPTLDDDFTELSSVVLSVTKEYEEKVEGPLKEKTSELMKKGEYAQVSQLINKLVEKSLNQ